MGPYEVIWLFRNINWNLVLCYLSVPYMVHKCPKTPKIGQINKTNVNRNYIYANIIGSDRYEPAGNLPVFPPVFSVFCIFSSKFTILHRKKWKKKIFFTLLPNDFSDFIMCSQIKKPTAIQESGGSIMMKNIVALFRRISFGMGNRGTYAGEFLCMTDYASSVVE